MGLVVSSTTQTRTQPHGSVARLAPPGWKPPQSQYANSMANYGLPFGQGTPKSLPGKPNPRNQGPGANGSIYNSKDADYIRNLPTGYTPEQELAMRNRIRATDTAQNVGSTSKMRDYMASMGLGGSGAEAAALGGLFRDQNAMRQGALSNLDISNSQTDLANRYGKAGLLNQLMGTGLAENRLAQEGDQFNTSQYNDMYKWANTTDYGRYQDRLSNSQYNSQLQMLFRQLGLG